MPHELDLSAAVPRCNRVRDHATGIRCGLPMVYSYDGNVWKCPKDGTSIKGALLAEWRRAEADATGLAEAA